MARGDMISIISPWNNSSTYFTMQPASGDEWMITGMGCDSTTQYIYMVIVGGVLNYMYFREWDTDTTTTHFMKSAITENPIKWFINNGVYIKSRGGASYRLWIMGIKTKE